MNLSFVPRPETATSCEPITCTRRIGEVPAANRPLEVWQRERVETAVQKDSSRAAIPIHLYEDAWLSEPVLERLLSQESGTLLRDSNGDPLAWTGEEADPISADAPGIDIDDCSFRICYPWDLLRVNEILVGALTESKLEGEVSPACTIEGTLIVGAGTRVLPGVFVEGNVIIGRDCKIGPNCYLRGNTSIGDHCHIGQAVEVKNSLIMDRTSIAHLSYCGDSVIGSKVNFGAGTISANLRHDGRDQRFMVGDQLVDTGRRKLGVVVGDGVHTGIHTSFYPGRKLWPGTATTPGTVVQRDYVQT